MKQIKEMDIWNTLEKVISVCFYFAFAFVLFICISEKTNLHCDEVYTYVLSNNTSSDSITVAPQWYYIYENPDEVWLKAMTVQSGEQFNFINVWEKQAADTHPPVYYTLVHIICSLFPNVYSKWFAGAVNIIFGLLTFLVGRMLVKQLTDKKMPLFFVSCCLIFSAGLLSAMTFFRMYIVAMFFVSLISYIFIKGIEQRDYKFYLFLFFASVLGVLTHYYFVIYLLFICIVFGIMLLVKKQWKSFGTFVGTMILAGGSTIAVFPTMLRHVFGESQRGAQTMSILTESSWSSYMTKVKASYSVVDGQLFGGLFSCLLLAGIITYILCFIKNKKCKMEEESNKKKNIEKWLLLGVPTLCYFFFVAKIAVFITDRYFHMIYAMIIILTVTALCLVFENLLPKKIAFVLLLIVFLFSTFKEFDNNWYYLYRGTQSFLDNAMTHSDKDCIHIFNNIYEVDPAFYEIRNYDRVVFVPNADLSGLDQLALKTDDGLIVSVGTACDFGVIQSEIRNIWPELESYEVIGGHSFSVTYYFY